MTIAMAMRCRTILLTLALLGIGGCSPQETLKLGFISGQTGAFSDLGAAGLNGAILAVEERNAKGGVAGKAVTLIIRDDEHIPAKARAAFNELVKAGVVAIVGPMTSGMATELIPAADEAKIVLMGGTVVTNRVSGKDDYFLRAIAPTNYYAAYSAGVHWQQLKPGRVTVLYDAANRDYAESWAKEYAAALERLNGTVCTIVEIDSRLPQNLMVLGTKLMANAPDLITFVSSAKTAAGLMRVVREKHADVRFAVSAWAANQLLLEMAGQSAEGMIAEQYHDLFDQSAAYVRFDESYRNRFKRQPDYAAVIAYDATNLLLDGLADTRATARSTGLKEALLQKQDFTGLQTAIKLDRYGDASRSGFTAVVRNGQYSPLR